MNEEELRGLLLLPYLRALGVAPGEIRLEKSFRLRLGRTVVDYEGQSRSALSGRLDILVRNAIGDNLFIIEVKQPDHELTVEDRDQGVTYARLLDQIAPFLLLTNGRKTELWDVVTKQQIRDATLAPASSFWKNGRVLASPDDIAIRFEALNSFLGYRAENVRLFSRRQQEEQMQSLRGSADLPNRKYIPELYVAREQVLEAVNRFLGGTNPVLAIIGQSGVEKTNEACVLAERLSETHATLFFSAAALTAGPGETLASEFNWQFTEQLAQPELIKRLAGIAKATREPIIIIIDALDEAVVPLFEQLVGQFVSRITDFSGQIRLIVTAKSSEWERFTHFRGLPSPLGLSVGEGLQHPSGEESLKPGTVVMTEFAGHELLAAEYNGPRKLDH